MRHISIHLFSLVIPCLFMSFCPSSALCPFLFTPFPNQVSNQGFQFEGRLSLPLLLVWGIMFWVLDQSQFKKHLCNILLSYICHLYCWSRWLKNAIVTPGPIKHWLDFLMNLGNGKGKKNHPTRVKHVGQNEILIFFCMVKNTTPPPWFSSIIRTPFKHSLHASKCLLIDLHGNNTSRHHSLCYSLVSSDTVIYFCLPCAST